MNPEEEGHGEEIRLSAGWVTSPPLDPSSHPDGARFVCPDLGREPSVV